MKTLVSESLHVSAKIHAFFRDSRALGFGIARLRDAKSLSSLVRVVGGKIGSHMRRPRYLVCSLRVVQK